MALIKLHMALLRMIKYTRLDFVYLLNLAFSISLINMAWIHSRIGFEFGLLHKNFLFLDLIHNQGLEVDMVFNLSLFF